jgi:hypothetical protein
MANNIETFTYEGGEKISVQPINQDITKAVRAADLNGIADKLNEIITVVNDMNDTIIIPDPSIRRCISGITVNNNEVDIQNGWAHITITDNDSFTTEYKEKLEGIEDGAQVNIIEAITVNGAEVTPGPNKIISLDMLDETITGSTVNCKLKNNTFTTCSDIVSSLTLEIPSGICAMFQFTTSADFNGGTLTIPTTYFINNQISFDVSKTYLVSVDHNVIIWNEIEQYIE